MGFACTAVVVVFCKPSIWGQFRDRRNAAIRIHWLEGSVGISATESGDTVSLEQMATCQTTSFPNSINGESLMLINDWLKGLKQNFNNTRHLRRRVRQPRRLQIESMEVRQLLSASLVEFDETIPSSHYPGDDRRRSCRWFPKAAPPRSACRRRPAISHKNTRSTKRTSPRSSLTAVVETTTSRITRGSSRRPTVGRWVTIRSSAAAGNDTLDGGTRPRPPRRTRR